MGERVRAFLPKALPPEPPLVFMSADHDLLEQANRAVGRLDAVSELLPDPDLFLYIYVRKEALLSSQIEGTQSSLSDLLLFESDETPSVPLDDVREVSSYVRAMAYGLERLGRIPLSLRLLREIHGEVLEKRRGSDKDPGEFRRTQNWIGGTRPGTAQYVPPPPDRIMECMGALELFLHDRPVRTPALVKAALAHVQFESIHPFLDGNGRLGRLLITFILFVEKALTKPTLYLSLYFKTHRDEYYGLLQRVRVRGDWEAWLRFFLEGVLEVASEAFETAMQIRGLFAKDRARIEGRTGRAAGSILRVHELMQRKPLLSIAEAARTLELSVPTISMAFDRMRQMKIVVEATKRGRGRMFAYGPYMDLLNKDMAPLPPGAR